jgi:hypothetical protein
MHVETAGLQPKSLFFFYAEDRHNVKSKAFLFGHINHQMNDLDAYKPQSVISEKSKLNEARSIRSSVLVQKKVPKKM